MYYKPNNSLVIHNITKEDAGTFVCLIFFSPALEVKHVVHVFAVKWVKKGKHETGEGIVLTTEPNLILNSVDRRDSGVYECIAENDQGPKASASVTVRINFPHYLLISDIPEISVEEDLVATGEGYDATLKCVVHAEPKANIEWVYNTDPISPSDRVLFSQQGHTHILEIKKVEPKDFGKYTCRATNNQGSEVSKVIELTGKPNIPHFISAIVGPDGKSLNVELEIISYSPMMEYKLLYKQLDKGNHSWITVKTPVVDPEGSTLFKVKHTLQDLPVGDYVVSFRARNGFGWSNQARPYAFTIKETSHENHEATAETSKMEGR
ncbi:hypothetical protein C0J52_20058 [Blattella germanica]|nr:hypothetical protein C0J52_20058 [Blattella germanica]